jgi:hypothetical protein
MAFIEISTLEHFAELTLGSLGRNVAGLYPDAAIHLYVDPDKSMNAYASARSVVGSATHGHTLGVHNGLVINTVALISTLFCQPSFFPELGEAGQPGVPDYLLREIQWSGPVADEFAGRGLSGIQIDGPRADAARIAANTAIMFVCYHELGHIIDGHVRWLVDRHQVTRLWERGRNKAVDPLTLHCLELRADLMAREMVLKQMRNANDARFAGAGAAILMSALSEDASLAEFEELDHPHPLLRALSLSDQRAKFLSDSAPAEVHEAWRRGFYDCIANLNDFGIRWLFLRPLQDSGLMKRHPGEVATTLVEYCSRWQHRVLDRSKELERELAPHRCDSARLPQEGPRDSATPLR